MATYYHATPKANYFQIVKEGIRPGIDGLVHLTTDANHAAGFILLRKRRGLVGVFEVDIDPADVQSFSDGALSGASHYVHVGPISSERLTVIPKWWKPGAVIGA